MLQDVKSTGQPNDDRHVLDDLNAQYVGAVEAGDADWFERNLAPDFMNSNPDGSIASRAEFIAQIAAGSGLLNIRAHDVIVRIHGECAIIHARTTFDRAAGRSGAARYTDIWAKRNGRWLCIGAHVTRC